LSSIVAVNESPLTDLARADPALPLRQLTPYRRRVRACAGRATTDRWRALSSRWQRHAAYFSLSRKAVWGWIRKADAGWQASVLCDLESWLPGAIDRVPSFTVSVGACYWPGLFWW